MKSEHPGGNGAPRYPGVLTACDGSQAIVSMETAASEAAGAYPITPSTQMGEGWAAAMAAGEHNVYGRKLIFFEPEGEHAAAAVTAGMSMVGLRSTNFSSGQGIAYMHESLYPAVGKRLTYVLNVACRAMTKQALNVHAGHDDYHAIDDTGFFQVFAKDVQESADLNLIAHRIAELSLNPGVCAQDGFLTSHVIETVMLPERDLIREYLGSPNDQIEAPTPAQRLVFGGVRRRIPELFDLDDPAMLGVVQNQDAYAQGVAAQRPFYFDHVAPLTDRAMDEYFVLTGRRYRRTSGYRTEDAEIVILGQGSVVSNAEAVCDHLRAEGWKVGVVNMTMFRPFPADHVSTLLAGKKAAVVLERVDQPLAVDPPLLREVRAALGQGLENGRTTGDAPYPGVAALNPTQVPHLYSGIFGLGSRDLQPGDIIAALTHARDGRRRRQFYLGIDFVRQDTHLPKLELWQEKLVEAYPDLAELSLPTEGDPNLMPEGAVSIRIHSVGGWGAITMGKNLALTASELLGLHIKANPKYGSEKKGQPTTFYATLARAPIRLNCELRHVDVVLSPDPNVFHHSNPLAGLSEGGVFAIQSSLGTDELWASLPSHTQREIQERGIRVFHVDAFAIASAEASDPELRLRMQGAAFMGAFFRVSSLREDEGLDEETILAGIRSRFEKKFGHLGERVVEDNLRVIRRGYEEVHELDPAGREIIDVAEAAPPHIPVELTGEPLRPGVADPARFWDQVGFLYKSGDDGIADPFAAISAIPAATSTIRDMTDMRFEVPKFVAEKCTGCAQCWTQCPDSAIPGMVHTVEQVLHAALESQSNGRSFSRIRSILPQLANEARRVVRTGPFSDFGDVIRSAFDTIVGKLNPDPKRRAELSDEIGPIVAALSEFPLARTIPFFEIPEGKSKGSGGLLSITVSPEACKGCNICVDVCPDGALVTVEQTDEVVEGLRRNWDLWRHLPETDDRYTDVAHLDEGIGVLSSLLLKRENYRAMVGGDGACMGCGEKTAIHLVVSAVHAWMTPRVKDHVVRLEERIVALESRARELLASDADLSALEAGEDVGVHLAPEHRAEIDRLLAVKKELDDLLWRYVEGPTGRGRSPLAFTNSTGCSSVWASTYPYNPYPFPWANHLFQDAPSLAIGVFEGHMRKMADGFIAIRRADKLIDGSYDPDEDEKFFAHFDWHEFSEDELGLCPPIFAVGGDGAMMDIGFQNLSRLLASGKPIRVVVLDTQVYSNTGGQACTSGFTGQVSDMAAYGPDQHGKTETRKELSLLTIAHRGAYLLQSSQANASHLLGGVLKGLSVKRPAVFLLHCPCPPEHGLADDAATGAARLSLESRAFPLLSYDPDAGSTIAECLSLEGNPAVEDDWPTYELSYLDDAGIEATITVPMTIADWAATEARFKKHFRPLPEDCDEEAVPFDEYVALAVRDRAGKTPFIHALGADRRLTRVRVAGEIVELAEDRLALWRQYRLLGGLEVDDAARTLVSDDLAADLEDRIEELRAEYEGRIADLRARYPVEVARRLAAGLLAASGGEETLAGLLQRVEGAPVAPLAQVAAAPVAPAPVQAAPSPIPAPPAAPAAVVEDDEDDEDEDLVIEPWIESVRCTSCNECTNINSKLFAYDEKKRAYIKDPRAGTFKQLVMAAEKCPVLIIHPGTPLDPKEKGLEKLLERAAAFQ